MCFGFVNLGVKELILILLIVLVIFGPKKLPEIGRSFGKMLANFRSGTENPEQKAGNDENTSKNDENTSKEEDNETKKSG